MRMLIVEDEEALAKGLKFNFEQEGFEVALAGDGTTAVRMFEEAAPPFEIVILDLMLPGMSGYEVCRHLRQRDPRVSVIVLSARTLSEDRSMAFDAGTDQYLSKPFALPELISRVRNLTERRRSMFAPTEDEKDAAAMVLEFGDGIVINFDRFELSVRGTTHALTTTELQLLRYFVQHDDKVLSRSQIMHDVWGDSAAFGSRTIDNFVMRLRKLIETDPTAPRHLLSVRGTGYRFITKAAEGDPATSEDEPPGD